MAFSAGASIVSEIKEIKAGEGFQGKERERGGKERRDGEGKGGGGPRRASLRPSMLWSTRGIIT